MKRLDIEPTEDALLESIRSNCTDRNDDIIDFIKLLSETKGPYSFMIDASWGDGKTFFVKSIELVLRALNPHIASASCSSSDLAYIIDNLNDTDASILPFYFNAWDNDFADDPITALFACMAAEFDRNDLLDAPKVRDAIASVLDAGLAALQIQIHVSEIVSALTSESLISAFKSKDEVRKRITELADTSICEVANTLVIFIDELDRCRPDFAVRLLEQTKNLFSSENTILVFSADSSQLAKAVGGIYGPGFDTARFLERFFDERITMTPVDAHSFANDGKKRGGASRFDKLVNEVLDGMTVTIRDAYRLKHKLNAARSYYLEGNHQELPQMVACCTVLPLLVFIERDDIDLFRTITSGADFDALYEYGKRYEAFKENVKGTIARPCSNIHADNQQEFTDAGCKAYMHDLCMAIYGTPEGHPEYYEAMSHLGGSYSPSFDGRVYKQLAFNDQA